MVSVASLGVPGDVSRGDGTVTALFDIDGANLIEQVEEEIIENKKGSQWTVIMNIY